MNKPVPEHAGLLTAEEAAAYLGIGVVTLRRMRTTRRNDEKSGPAFITLGHRTIRYSKESLDAYIKEMSQ